MEPTRRFVHWTESEIAYLIENYPSKGKVACSVSLGRSVASIRAKASDLGLSLDYASDFFKEFQERAAKSKVGKKRPDQSIVMNRLHREGKLTKTDEQNSAASERLAAWRKEHDHPRGALGMSHSEESKKKLSSASKLYWANITPQAIRDRTILAAQTRASNGTRPRGRGTWKSAWRCVGGRSLFFRSRWEANYARYLEYRRMNGTICKWEYETKTFVFIGQSCKYPSYVPDFLVTNNDESQEYHEVKGWMDDASRSKIDQMASCYPDVVLRVIDGKAYGSIERDFAASIPEWEFKSEHARKRFRARGVQLKLF